MGGGSGRQPEATSSVHFDDKAGPELQRDDRGEYVLDEIPLTTETIADVKLLPEESSHVLRAALERGDLLTTV
ncbi:hypothetical protein ACTPOK_10100 [Streptomyces inhibens]|uniref:hypothetical protein n=1 Tax=Streptomyces inhibens TaxID=2293571 RepID=UPI00402A8671